MNEPVFFYSNLCPICPAVLTSCADFFISRKIPLVARRPYLSEQRQLPGLPALYVPGALCISKEPHVLVGENIPEWLVTIMGEKPNDV